MRETGRTWGKFVSSRLFSYVNNSNYNLKRVLLLYAIRKNLPINVGRMIFDGMMNCRFRDDCEHLYFPSTITRVEKIFKVNTEGLAEIRNGYLIE